MTRIYLMALAVLIVGGCKKATTTPAVVHTIYDFSYTYIPPTGAPPYADQHTFSFATTAPAGSTLLWSFGDGDSSVAAAPQHIYFGTGPFTVSLIVNGDTAHIISKLLYVGRYLLHGFVYTGAPLTDSPLTFHSNVFTDSTFLWDFGDGVTATDTAPMHTYHAPGTYTVKLTINGNAATAVTSNVVISTAPLFTAHIATLRRWHDTAYNITFTTTTTYPRADTPFTLTYINPAQVAYFGRNLYYVPAASTAGIQRFAGSFRNSSGNIDSMALLYFTSTDSMHMEQFTIAAGATSKEVWTTP